MECVAVMVSSSVFGVSKELERGRLYTWFVMHGQ
jgi:hypothetical protein